MLWPVTNCFCESESLNEITCFQEVVGDQVKISKFLLLFCKFLSFGECINEENRERQSIQAQKAQKVSWSEYWRGDSDKYWDLWEKSLQRSLNLHYLTDYWSLPVPLLSTMNTIDKLNLQSKPHTYSICFSFFLCEFSLGATPCTCTFCWFTLKSNFLTCISKMISISYTITNVDYTREFSFSHSN